MQRESNETWREGGIVSRLGRRSVLRAGAGAAAGLLVGGGSRTSRAATARQSGGFTVGGRWIEAESFRLAQRGDPSQFIVFTAEFPFYALAPSWSGEGDPGASVELLWSVDGVTWSEPIWIGRASHTGRPDRDGRNIGSLVSTPGATFVQYRTYDSAGNFAPLPGFEIDYIDASAGPSLEQVASPATSPVFSAPPVISRAAWGADEALRFGKSGREIFPVEYQPVEHVIIHHADTGNFHDPVLEMRSIYYFHSITRGWGDIAYNYLVDFMGNVYEGRVGGETAVGCHAEGYNAGSCGVCLMGRFFSDPATPEMHNAIVWISSWAARDLDPTGAAPFHDIGNLPTICGHRDVNNTSCPGDEFYVQLDTIREEARQVISGRADPEPPPPQWSSGARVITNAEGASLRTGPGVDFDRVTTVTSGEPLMVLQGPTTNEATIWYEVRGVSLKGWIAANLLVEDPNPNPVPFDPLPTQTPVATPPDASEPPPVETPVGGGDEGEERDRGRRDRDKNRRQETWQEAWPVFAAGTMTTIVDGPLNLRLEPALSASILTALATGSVATVIAGPVDSEGIAWYQVVTPEGSEGWCDSSFLEPVWG